MESLTLPGLTRAASYLETPAEELRAWFAGQGEPAMRLKQVRRWIFAGRASSFASMTDLPRGLRERLDERFPFFSSRVDRAMVSTDGTEKLLVRLADGNLIECVLLKEADRRTACISTQVGCGMGCVFCTSGIGGVVRNLTGTEILEQLLHV